jgi:hypothetical protein
MLQAKFSVAMQGLPCRVANAGPNAAYSAFDLPVPRTPRGGVNRKFHDG